MAEQAVDRDLPLGKKAGVAFFDFGVTFISRIVVLATALGGQSCLAWILGPSGRGAYAVCILFGAMLTLVFLLGCDSASLYFVASRRITLSEGLVYTIIYGLIGSLLAVTAGLSFYSFPSNFFPRPREHNST